jgi:hypothetical protein
VLGQNNSRLARIQLRKIILVTREKETGRLSPPTSSYNGHDYKYERKGVHGRNLGIDRAKRFESLDVSSDGKPNTVDEPEHVMGETGPA